MALSYKWHRERGHEPKSALEICKAAPVACREAGISHQSYYRWRKEYDGLEVDQAKRMNELERENVRLKRLVAYLSPGEADPEGCCWGKLVPGNAQHWSTVTDCQSYLHPDFPVASA